MSGRTLTLEDVLAAARALAACETAGAGARESRRLAERILLRAALARALRRRTGRGHPRFGDGSVAAAADSLMRDAGAARAASCEALLSAGAIFVEAVLAADRPQAGSVWP